MKAPECPTWYIDWVKDHLLLFALKTTDNVATLSSWWEDVAKLRTSYDELLRTSRILLGQADTLKSLAYHFPALKRTLLSERQFELTRQENLEREKNTRPLSELYPDGIAAEFNRRCGIGNSSN